MGFIAIWDISLFFKNIVTAFVNYTGVGGPTHVFENLGHWVNVVRGFNYGAQTLLGDSILVRLHHSPTNKLVKSRADFSLLEGLFTQLARGRIPYFDLGWHTR